MASFDFLTLVRCLAPGLRPPVVEYKFSMVGKWQFDFCWPNSRVAVEIDGGQYAPHGGRHATDQDKRKGNRAAAEGWRVLHFSPQMLEQEPEECIGVLLEALQY